ncbi:MAG: hypothetical protein ACLPKB_25705 [Xanthobacteraceae bacterium]
MEAFVCRQNIELYRKLLEGAADETRRQEIMRLLAAEEAKLKRVTKRRFAGA